MDETAIESFRKPSIALHPPGIPQPRHHQHRGGVALREGQQLVQAGLRQRSQVQGHPMGEALPLSWYVYRVDIHLYI